MLETGTSGGDAKVVVVIPLLIFVLPTRITRTPLASITRSRSGNAAPPCETRIAGPCSLPGSVGVFARAPPTNEPLRAFERVRGEHRFRACFLQRRQPRRQLLGQLHHDRFEVRLAGRPMLSVVSRLAPLAFEVFALVFDLNEGLNGERPAVVDLERSRQVLRPRTGARRRMRQRRFGRRARRSWSG